MSRASSSNSTYVYNPNPHPLPFLHSVFAGGVAGVMEILTMYPLDVVKTRLQLQQTNKLLGSVPNNALVVQYNSVLDCFKKIIQQESFLTLYRGIMAPICAEAPKRAVKFSTNEGYKSMLTSIGMPNNETKMMASGLLAGVTEAFVNCPFEVVKVRMQAKSSVYRNTIHAVQSIVTVEGVGAVYKGIVPQILRNGIWNSIYFALIFTLKNRILLTPKSKSQEMGRNFIAGVVSGTIATVCSTPFDCIKSRMQSVIGEQTKWKSVFGTMSIIYKEEGGLPAVFKGLAPRLIRLAPGGGIMLVAFDFISGWLATDERRAH